MELPAYIEQLQRERRQFAIHNQQLQRSQQLQKQKADRFEQENTKLRQINRQLEKEKAKLLEELEKTKAERDTYKNLTFTEKRACSSPASHKQTGKKRGGQTGHTGVSRTLPEHIHEVVRISLSNCPDCGLPLCRVDACQTHTVTDLPDWKEMQPITTQYQIERQWCSHCHKEVHGTPKGVIPGSRLGSVLVTMVLVWKYRMREPLGKIAERLKTHYGITVTEGGLQRILAQARLWLGSRYKKLINEVRGSPVKHADETSWPIGKENGWAWVFVDPKTAVYTIEESRGGGVAKEMLAGAVGVLVRDDYAGYKALPLIQQSCWAHLLRKSHEASIRQEASGEVKKLHKKLVTLFGLLAVDTVQPFKKNQRQRWHGQYWVDLQKIITASYCQADAKRIQMRIRNQGKNLLTALLYPNVPLTNNAAERAIMPLVLTRKISRGSKTLKGAKIHAVIMSVIETITKRKQPILTTLQAALLQGYSEKR